MTYIHTASGSLQVKFMYKIHIHRVVLQFCTTDVLRYTG